MAVRRRLLRRMLRDVCGCPWILVFCLFSPQLAAPRMQDAQSAGSSSIGLDLRSFLFAGVCVCDLLAPRGAEVDALAGMA